VLSTAFQAFVAAMFSECQMANANSLLLAIQLPLLKRATEGKRRVEMENA